MFKTDRTVAAPIDVRGKVIHDPALIAVAAAIISTMLALSFTRSGMRYTGSRGR